MPALGNEVLPPGKPRRGMRAWHALVFLGQSTTARTLRDGMLWLVPYLMLWSTLLLGAEIAKACLPRPAIVSFLGDAASALRAALPLVLWGSMGAMRAVQLHLPRTAVAFVCVACGLILQLLLKQHSPDALPFFVLFGICGPLVTVPLLAMLMRLQWTHLAATPNAAGPNVSDALNLVLPALITVATMAVGVHVAATALMALPDLHILSLLRSVPSGVLAAVYCALNSILWLFGIHGYYTLLPVLETLPKSPAMPYSLVNEGVLGAFVFVGGSGATSSLILAILLFGKQRKHRLVAIASIAPAIINVNELLLFGLPVILNVRLSLPFVLVPLMNLALTSIVVAMGWIGPISADLPFTSPIGLNALITTGGDYAAVLLQGFNVAIGALVYAPFVRAWERDLGQAAPPPLKAIDTSYRQRREEAAVLLDDPVGQSQRVWSDRKSLEARLTYLDNFDFELHYQPQVDPASGHVTGCEALLRLDDGEGHVLTPDDFLPDFERARLMVNVDLWVMSAMVAQLSIWRDAQVPPFDVSVNVSADSLSDRAAIADLERLVSVHPGRLVIEITEHSLVGDEAVVKGALDRLRKAGARIHIDDFGTGFSSLSYLHRFTLDGIKIDRSFTSSLQDERGRRVFKALCSFAAQLGLELVVEGLEHAWQLEHLPGSGTPSVQGWFYSAALPPDRFIAFVKARNRRLRSSLAL